MKTMLKSSFLGLGLLIGLSFILLYLTNHYILTPRFYSENGDPLLAFTGQDQQIYENLQKWIYLSTALYLTVKLLVVSLVLYTALYLKDNAVAFSRIFKVVVFAEYIFLLAAVMKFFWFRIEYPNGSITDWHQVYILSALTFFKDAAPVWYYPLQTINLFEVAYWFLLALGLTKITHFDFDNALRIVVTSYLPLLIVWVVVVVFCVLMALPTNV